MARIVVAKNRLPWPPHTGTDVVTFNFLRALAGRHEVTFVSLVTKPLEAPARGAFEQAGIRLIPVMMPNKGSWPRRIAFKLFYTAAAGLLATPRDLWYYNPPVFKKAVAAAAAGADLLQCEYWYLYPTADEITGVRKVLLAHDAEFNANRRQVEENGTALGRLGDGLTYLRRKGYEREACGRFDHVVCLSAADAALLAPWCRRPPRICFPLVDVPSPAAMSTRGDGRTLVYFGGTRRFANHHGLTRFLREIYPSIRREVPGVRFLIKGERPRPALMRIIERDASITWAPAGDDLAVELAAAAAAVVPLWVGAGIKIKILTALSYGLPVVTTVVGAEGIAAGADDGMAVAATAEDFTAAVAALLRDADYWRRRAAGARRFAENELAFEKRAPAVAALYDELAAS